MIRVFDNVLSPAAHRELLAYLQGQDWRYGAYSGEGPSAPRYFYKHFAGHFRDGEEWGGEAIDAELVQFPLIAAAWRDIQTRLLQGHVLKRCYANAYPVGSEGSLHKDSLEPNHFTAIYYPHLTWHADYAGETVFFNEEGGEIVASVYPKPNRLAVFPGTIPHVARGVSRQCPELRITLMFKTTLPAAAA